MGIMVRKNPSRTARKVRPTDEKFSDESDDAQSFWNQDAFREGSDSEGEDNDFDAPDSSGGTEEISEGDDEEVDDDGTDEEAEKKAQAPAKKRKRNAYVDPAVEKKGRTRSGKTASAKRTST